MTDSLGSGTIAIRPNITIVHFGSPTGVEYSPIQKSKKSKK